MFCSRSQTVACIVSFLILIVCLGGCGVQNQPINLGVQSSTQVSLAVGTGLHESQRLAGLACSSGMLKALGTPAQCSIYVAKRLRAMCNVQTPVGVEWMNRHCQSGLQTLEGWAGENARLATEQARAQAATPKISLNEAGSGGAWLALSVAERITMLEERPQDWRSDLCQSSSRLASDIRAYYSTFPPKSKEFNEPVMAIVKNLCF